VGYDPYLTENGVTITRLDINELLKLQTVERLMKDEARKFKVGEHKIYINDFFFLQPEQRSRFRIF
jgi:hypothetical protein